MRSARAGRFNSCSHCVPRARSAIRSDSPESTGCIIATPTRAPTCTRRCTAGGRAGSAICSTAATRRMRSAPTPATSRAIPSSRGSIATRGCPASRCSSSHSSRAGSRRQRFGVALGAVLLLHQGAAVNWFSHRSGRRRFDANDRSTNHWLVAILSFGEGWHNNHHAFPGSARAGLAWYEIDPAYAVICILEATGVIWNVRRPPACATNGASWQTT